VKKLLRLFLPIVFFFVFCVMSACFAEDGDPCKDQGIAVKNLALKEVWYQSKGGNCVLLKRRNAFTIKPGEEIGLFSDIVCKTPYCPASLYTDYKTYDVNGDCKVRILPHNTLSDM